jgi:hypothetical protein
MLVSARRLVVAGLVSLAPGSVVADDSKITYPATAEFDVVFPRNETYAPFSIVPIVFAIQNPEAAKDLALNIQWSLGKIGIGALDSGLIDLTWTNFTSDPYYVVTSTYLTNVTEGAYNLLWELSAGNCSDGAMEPSYASLNNVVTFTIQDGAQAPDLVAAVGADTCAAMPSRTFNVTGTLPIQADPLSEDGRNTCAVLGQPTPTADPCNLKLDSAEASSISATITASACAGAHPHLATGCPQATKTANLAARSELGEARVGIYIPLALLGVLCFLKLCLTSSLIS